MTSRPGAVNAMTTQLITVTPKSATLNAADLTPAAAWLSLRHRDTGDTETEPADGLFVLIGAQPFTDWLPEAVGRDQWGYILTSPDLAERWTLQRESYLLETSTPGVFAVGDVRHGSVKRVASAVGDGSIAIRLAHDYLA